MGISWQRLRTQRLSWVAILVCSLTANAPPVYAQDRDGADDEASDSDKPGTAKKADDGEQADSSTDGKSAKKRRTGPNREGEYSGIVPDRAPEDGKRKKRKKRKNAISWVGFQPLDGGRSRLFVRMANELQYTQQLVGNVLYVNIVGARYRHRNTRRRLDTRHFDTSLKLVTNARVSARRARKNRHARQRGIELKISFKDSKDAREASASMSAGKDGYTYLFLEFPPAAGAGSVTISDPE